MNRTVIAAACGVAAHAHGTDGIRNAVRAGITTVDHGSVLDEATVREMAQRGTWLVPTMMAPRAVGEMARAGQLPPGPTRKALELEPQVSASHQRAIRGGVRIAFGTDAGVFAHGRNAEEFALLVQAGMTPAQALLAATRNAAEALGRSDDLGAIAPGRIADIIAVRGNPLQDVTILQDVGFVMKDGVVHKRDGTPVVAR
jgi:imidazolonepropionase-like amidohydrolase